MTRSAGCELLTIGHSNLTADRFVALLKHAGVTAIADVRSVPFSRRYPWFSQRPLAERLARERIAYVPLGEALGGRPSDPSLYRDGVADFSAIAHSPQFSAGLDRVIEGAQRFRVCLMCAEREPLECHRCLLIAPALVARRVALGHILADGTIEPHVATEARLLAASGEDDLFQDRAGRLAEACRGRTRARSC